MLCQASVAQQFETGPSWGVGVVCCITADPHHKSGTRRPASDAIYPTKSKLFSIIRQDNTDFVVDLRRLLQHAQTFELCLYRPFTSILPTSNGARAPSAVAGPHTVLLLHFRCVLSQCYCASSACSVLCTVLESNASAKDLLGVSNTLATHCAAY